MAAFADVCFSLAARAYDTCVRLVLRLLRWLFLLCLTPVLLLLSCQSRLIYHPQPYGESHQQELVKHQSVPLRYKTKAGLQVAYYIPPRIGDKMPKAVWLCFSGNAALAADWLRFTDQWDAGYGYLLIDYPGYGDCQGLANPSRILESSVAAHNALVAYLETTKEELRPRLGVIAHSIGCAAGLMTARELTISRAILVAPFTTLTEMGRILIGWPLCHINMHRFDNRRELEQIVSQGAQVVIYHGTADQVIPISMSRELAAAHPDSVILHEKTGWDHNLILRAIAPEMGKVMRAFSKQKAQKSRVDSVFKN